MTIIVTAVLVLMGMPSPDALALTFGSGLVGAAVARTATTGSHNGMLRRVAGVLSAPALA
ncbi:hypothetical protein [Streptomyces sp. NPDC088730]|uniref:hypothetical protein n=1 Tax=Streptomyces sp. NPDC088730 TaxID=3365877 RepID=UPI00380B15FE